ncbi:MAG: DUF4382 domain-containing protein [Planctomycetota bacterium]|nr:MAG: DUF4382 domain-containing protein [Planctomycetota bacterium]
MHTKTLSGGLALLVIALGLGSAGCSGSSGGGGAASPGTTVALTDAPSSDLSALRVDITALEIRAASGATHSLLPGPLLGQDLLRLRRVSKLLNQLVLPAGRYDQITFTYQNAVAYDRLGNALTVSPPAGAVSQALALSLPAGGAYLEVDVRVDDSLSNVVLGAGGSLRFDPVLKAEVDPPGATPEVEDFSAVVRSVSARGLEVALGGGRLAVELEANALVVSGGQSQSAAAAGFDLRALVAAGQRVEVRGRYDVSVGIVRARELTVEDGQNFGPRVRGVVVGLAPDQVTLRVTDGKESGLTVGSQQTFSYGANTNFAFDDAPPAPASSANLALGAELQLAPANAVVREVRFRDTRLEGTVTARSGNQLTIDVQSVERVDVALVPGFANPVVVTLDGSAPSFAQPGARVSLDGHFLRGGADFLGQAATLELE